MTMALVRPAVIISGVAVLLSSNAKEIKAKRRALESSFAASPADDAMLTLARAEAFQTQANE
jgi:hypothetical protein